MLMQSVRWMETPRPRVTKPTISSPGTGLQHFESFTKQFSIPSTTMPPTELQPIRSGITFTGICVKHTEKPLPAGL